MTPNELCLCFLSNCEEKKIKREYITKIFKIYYNQTCAAQCLAHTSN